MNFQDAFSTFGNVANAYEAFGQASDLKDSSSALRGQIQSAATNWLNPGGGSGSGGNWGFTPVQYQPVSYIAGSRPEMGYNGASAAPIWSGGHRDNAVSQAPGAQDWFDEDAYLRTNKDVADAVARGDFTSGAQHFALHGRNEGRLFGEPTSQAISYQQKPTESAGTPTGFDEAAYLRTNKDVANAVARGEFASGRDHWERFGRNEGRLFGEVGEINNRIADDSSWGFSPAGAPAIPSATIADAAARATSSGMALPELVGMMGGLRGSNTVAATQQDEENLRKPLGVYEQKSGIATKAPLTDQQRADISSFFFANTTNPGAIADAMKQYGLSAQDVSGVIAGQRGLTDADVQNYLARTGLQTGNGVGFGGNASDKQSTYSQWFADRNATENQNRDMFATAGLPWRGGTKPTVGGASVDVTRNPTTSAGSDQVSQAIRSQLAALQITGGGQAALDSFLVSGRYTPEQLASASGYKLSDVQAAIVSAQQRGAKPPVQSPGPATFGARPSTSSSSTASSGGFSIGGGNAQGRQINAGAQGDFYNQQVPINAYSTAGVDERASQIFARLVGGVDRANSIAASQGFANALRNGVGNSTAAAATADELTRKFSDVYAKLTEDAAKGALSENQSNYASYLTGVNSAINQNNQVAGNNNSMNNAIMSNDTARMNAALSANTSLQNAIMGNQTNRGNAAIQALLSLYGADRVSLANAQNARGQALNNLLANPAIQSIGQSAINSVLSRLGGNQNPTQADLLDAIRNNPSLSPDEMASMLNIFGNNYTGNPYSTDVFDWGDVDLSTAGPAPELTDTSGWGDWIGV